MATEKPKHQPRHQEVPATKPRLDEKGLALSALVKEVFAEFNPEVGAELDEVVVKVQPHDVRAVCRKAKEDQRLAFNYLRCLSVVDYKESLQVVYHLASLDKRHKVVIKANVPTNKPYVPSVVPVWRGADWYEREGHDLYGVVFEGHPHPAPLLLYEGFEGYPGRKDYPFNDYNEW